MRGSYRASIGADQILIERIHVFVRRRYGFEREALFCNDSVEQQIELVGIACADENTLPVGIHLGFNHVILSEDTRSENTGTRAAHENLHGVFFYFTAHA